MARSQELARVTSHASSHPTSDLLFGWFYSAAVGGSTIALFFLGSDLIAGQPLLTPSILGSVLFFDTPAEVVVAADVMAVALYTAVHLVAFGLVGLAASVAYQKIQGRGRAADLPTFLLIWALLQAGFALAGMTLLPGVPTTLGVGRVTAGNGLAALAMVLLLRWEYRRTIP